MKNIKIQEKIFDKIFTGVIIFDYRLPVNNNTFVTVHAHTNHLLIGVENTSKSG